MKNAPILYTIVKRVMDRKNQPYPQWLVEHLGEIEAQPSSELMTAHKAMARLDALTKGAKKK